ncbi:MAG: cupin domain-containing protein [Eubacteriales bacterium]
MIDFPDFMKSPQNRIPKTQQNTQDIDGYFYQGADGGQMAFWTCNSAQVSKKHTHPFDEYTVCIDGEYTAVVAGITTVLHPGDELFVPKGTEQWGSCIAGTRTISAFGGMRICQKPF